MRQFIRLTVGYLVLSLSLGALAPRLARAGNITDAATGAGTVLAIGAVAAGSAGKAFLKKCWTPGGAFACPLAALSFAQAITSGGESTQSFKTRDYSACTDFGLCGGPTDSANTNGSNSDWNGLDGNADWFNSDYFSKLDPSMFAPEDRATIASLSKIGRESQAGLDQLAKKGYKFDPGSGSVTTPSGKKVSGDSMANAGAMAAAGLSKEEIAETMDILKKANAAGSSMGLSFGGGGGSRVAAGANDGSALPDFGALMRGLDGKKRGPASLDGMKKYIGSEPIGVAVDNIFEMVSRRYKSQAGQGAFLP
jgi:hypothetical protein